MLAPVHIPSCGTENQTVLMAKWEFTRDAGNNHANTTLMPPEAFRWSHQR